MHLLEMCCVCDWMGGITHRERKDAVYWDCCSRECWYRLVVRWAGVGGGVYINSVCSAVVCVN